MFCHENVIVANSGLSDERFHFTGDPAVYAKREDAQTRVDYLNGLGASVEVFPFIASEWGE